MKKFALKKYLIVSILFMGMCGMTYITMKEQKINCFIEEVAAYNLEVHNMLKYGSDNQYLYLGDIIESGEGSCRAYSTILYKKLRQRGYEAWYVGGISYYRNANHAMVEAEIAGKRYLFDPTYAVYYKNGLEELLACPELANNKIVQIESENEEEKESRDIFTSPDYFRNFMYQIRERDAYNVLKSLNSHFVLALENGEEQYNGDYLMDENEYSYYEMKSDDVELIFDEKINICSMVVCWNSTEEKKVIIEAWNGEKDEYIEIYNYWTIKATDDLWFEDLFTNKLKFTIIRADGEGLVSINEIYLYEDYEKI